MKTTNVIYRAHETKEHSIKSAIVAQTFKIKVQQPIRLTDDSERFPVLYSTDSDELFGGCASLANALQVHGETPRFVLVGIGYDDARAAELLRMRDFHTHGIRAHFSTETEQLASSPLGGDLADLGVITQTTDASDFLRFIRNELMPFIDAYYPTLRDDNSYFGYSAGGGFGLYTLFTQPDTFRRYVLGSPTTSHHGYHFAIELAEGFIRTGRTMDAKVFMSVGELEEFKKGLRQFDLVTGYYLLSKFLKEAEIPGLDLAVRLFPGETHATAWAPAFSHGLKALFGAVEQVPFWPEYFK